ncbi:acetyl/propionyl/methylcrotonyl-CoA carboxylase subunit alpha [Coralliovum pocilloporae]|uniref:acetyl/propionyl/methylcrotonyl-CoA carboxylase subunit alpha n=1 Tax=Coralliovum pocilloporae TaxID=3066369 RepID=UPI003307C2C9
MFRSLLIANRGEIACRIIRSARELGIHTVAVYSDADVNAMHVTLADEAYRIGPPAVAESYLKGDRIIEAARKAGADAIHPGYGFLSENPEFVEAVEAAGLVFVGPPASAIRDMGLKDAAKALMEEAGVPVVPGYHGDNQDAAFLASEADKIGYPVLIKARAGGGGKGMRLVEQPDAFEAALEAAQREGQSSFGDGRVLIEKYITSPRHIEIQVFGDSHGNVVHLFERDCSLQRRHQKVIEEAPAPGMTDAMRQAMGAAAVKAAKAVGYQGAGTVEFIVDGSDGLKPDRFWFMEMNTRLQVEHPVTELITGLDLVALQLAVASGAVLPFAQDDLTLNGWAFEARLYAEDPSRTFMPATGKLHHLSLPEELARIDTGVRQGDVITPFYDPMIAKVIVHGPNRDAALNRLWQALTATEAVGCTTNADFLARLTRQADFSRGDVDTGLIERHLDDLTAPAEPPKGAFAVAGLFALGLLKPKEGTDPWETLSGWRHWSEARQHISLDYQGDRSDLLVTAQGGGRFTVTVADEEIGVSVRDTDGDRYRLDLGGRIVTATIIPSDGRVSVLHQGRMYVFELPDLLADADDAAGGDTTLTAPLPGVITKLFVADGDIIDVGQPVLVMEAMKMEHTLTASVAGRVDLLFDGVGAQVEDGSLLARVMPPEQT